MKKKNLKIISWNVNGLRAVIKKGFLDYLEQEQADIVCLQECKILEKQVPQESIPYSHQYWNAAERKGYSGTGLLTQHVPLQYTTAFDSDADHPDEGRVQTAEFADFYLVNVYVPNAQRELARLAYRTEQWDRDFRGYLNALSQSKPVICCGDFNVAHQPIDLARPKANGRNPGFTDEERQEFSFLLETGFIDTFRKLHPDQPDNYTWWSYRSNARANNVGWRIDYVLISRQLEPRLKTAFIRPEIMGSDHCPIGVSIELGV